METEIPIFKVTLIGPHNTGKTSILNAFHKGYFDSNQQPTVGANFLSHIVTVDGNNVELQIWDTAGQEKYQSITPLYYRESQCAIGVFATDPPDSFDALKRFIEEFLNQCTVSDPVIVVVCNKIDLSPTETSECFSGREYAGANLWPFFTTSAKTGSGIDQLFTYISETLVNQKLGPIVTDTLIPQKSECKC